MNKYSNCPFPPFLDSFKPKKLTKKQEEKQKKIQIDNMMNTLPSKFISPIDHICKTYKVENDDVIKLDTEDISFEEGPFIDHLSFKFNKFLMNNCSMCTKFNQTNDQIEDVFHCHNSPEKSLQIVYWIKSKDKLIFYWDSRMYSQIIEIDKDKVRFHGHDRPKN